MTDHDKPTLRERLEPYSWLIMIFGLAAWFVLLWLMVGDLL